MHLYHPLERFYAYVYFSFSSIIILFPIRPSSSSPDLFYSVLAVFFFSWFVISLFFLFSFSSFFPQGPCNFSVPLYTRCARASVPSTALNGSSGAVKKQSTKYNSRPQARPYTKTPSNRSCFSSFLSGSSFLYLSRSHSVTNKRLRARDALDVPYREIGTMFFPVFILYVFLFLNCIRFLWGGGGPGGASISEMNSCTTVNLFQYHNLLFYLVFIFVYVVNIEITLK